MRLMICILFLVNFVFACAPENTFNHATLDSELNWEHLNPARGDKSPQAATLWGDRNGTVPTGFLVKFKDGFSSPPHIHNVSYRGIVISGHIHNADPRADELWMPVGSYWTQPRGHVHITAAKGETNVAFIEIDRAPYLVKPPTEAYETTEKPINVHASNLVWLGATESSMINHPTTTSNPAQPEIAYLWGAPGRNDYNGSLIKLPANFTGNIESQGSDFKGVVIQGQPEYRFSDTQATRKLAPGSFFTSEEASTHNINTGDTKDTLIYVRTNGRYTIGQ